MGWRKNNSPCSSKLWLSVSQREVYWVSEGRRTVREPGFTLCSAQVVSSGVSLTVQTQRKHMSIDFQCIWSQCQIKCICSCQKCQKERVEDKWVNLHKVKHWPIIRGWNVVIICVVLRFCLSAKMFGNWTFGTLVFTVMVITVTLKVKSTNSTSSKLKGFLWTAS